MAARFRHSISDADVPEHCLRRGDIVKLVDHHVASDGTERYSIEVFNALGGTLAVTSVSVSALEKRSAKMKCSVPVSCSWRCPSARPTACPGSNGTASIYVVLKTLSTLQPRLSHLQRVSVSPTIASARGTESEFQNVPDSHRSESTNSSPVPMELAAGLS
jgi:hypothetical protein